MSVLYLRKHTIINITHANVCFRKQEQKLRNMKDRFLSFHSLFCGGGVSSKQTIFLLYPPCPKTRTELAHA